MFITPDRVKQTSTTTTGIGAFALTGSVPGFNTFASKCSIGDTFYYCIQEVSGGAPTGKWEVGYGTYTAANTITRTRPIMNSYGHQGAIYFGTSEVFITVPSEVIAAVGEVLTTNRVYYVRTDGSDSNSGMANTADGAFATINKAIEAVSKIGKFGIDTSVAIHVQAGSFFEDVVLPNLGNQSVNQVGLFGAGATTLLTGGGGASIVCNGVWKVQGLKVANGNTNGIVASPGSSLALGSLTFGSVAENMIHANNARVTLLNACTLASSTSESFLKAINKSLVLAPIPFTLSGTVSISNAFYIARSGSVIDTANDDGTASYTGSATGAGKKYDIAGLSLLNSTVTVPGANAGSTASGGVYA